MDAVFIPPAPDIPVLDLEAWEAPWRLTAWECGHGPAAPLRSDEEEER